MEAKNKRVAIVGAGPSGLTACKHLLARGFRPVVFDAGSAVGGVWRRTLASTRLQTPAAPYRFSDFPWPEAAVAAEASFPRHDEVAAYLAAYARRFGVLERVRFGCRVVGAAEEEVAAWERWSGTGEAFGDGTGEWHLTVMSHDSGEAPSTQVHKFDFLILCVGRYGVAKLPTFPDGGGVPEAFQGRVLHSMEYSSMAHADAAELVRAKRVVVVGAGKSALDTAAQCAEANGRRYPCTLLYRSAHWMLDPQVAPRFKFSLLTTTRLGELMVHKPGEGLALSLVATMLTPLRWLIMKLREAYFKAHIPMEKHGMAASTSGDAAHSASAPTALVLDDDAMVNADVVILATGYDPDAPLRAVFTSPRFRDTIASSSSSDNNDAVLPLYRQCVHPRIPQMAVVGYAESGASVYPYEMMAKWVAHLLDGAVRLPGVREMEREVEEWTRWGRWARRSSGGFFLKSCIHAVTTWYHDLLCRDMGYSPRRKAGFLAEWTQPYGPADYAGIQ
ncbi:hypothetical protein PR202_gb17248 [Eleusine coracana subsp. coracana]|uniref:Flavin-containing monooxygenase n=1 Tax=Eleusine coracana subsp. coracana TaxID=191504 RepID=A0AAV5F460_ELECO|nr:hypothetical protein PR202_gb17248 [Eleusine coracana subsp. coracana]